MQPALAFLRTGARVLLVSITLPARLLLAAGNVSIGGQAVMEGVMMRSPHHWAVALRRRSGDIVELHRDHTMFAARHAWAKVPVVRGVVALIESLVIGFKALSVSAHYAAEDIMYDIEDVPTGDAAVAAGATPAPPQEEESQSPDSLRWWQLGLAFVFAIGFSVALFKLMPAILVDQALVDSKSGWFVFAEASVKITVFCVYLGVIGLLPDMKRVFQYHSAEHKAINALENGVDLTPEQVNLQSRIHVRCGTAFMLWVFVVAIAVFGVFGYYVKPELPEVIASRVIFLPLIAGLSFELIKFAGRHANNRTVRGVLAPGLWLQQLTTRECAEHHCEVAIRSLELVVDDELPNATIDVARHELDDENDAMQVMA